MRPVLLRPSIRLSVAACAVVAIAACRGEPGLPPAEVLDRAAHAAQQLASALFTADATVKGGAEEMNAALHAEGRLQDAGSQWDLTARLQLRNADGSSWDVTADVIVTGEEEIYIRAQNVRADPPSALPLPLPAEALQRWLRLPSSGNAPSPAVTPDPKFLAMQASVVQVTRDRGIVRLGDKRVYHYDVAVDPQKLREFLAAVARERGEEFRAEDADALLSGTDIAGQLWIDAETFQVLRIQWTASPLQKNGYEGSLSVQLRDHDAAPPVVPPEGAVPLGQLLGAPATPSFLDVGESSPDEQRRLQELLDQQ